MTTREALFWAVQTLKQKKISSATLDAEVLLAFVLGRPKEYLFTYPNHKLTNLQLRTYKLTTNRRAKREPVAYITGSKEFYGLDFSVNRNTLIPRPETELLVETTLNQLSKLTIQQINKLTLIDIGTGSGAIAIAIVKNLLTYKLTNLQTNLYATDYSPLALRLARQNARRLLPPLSKGAGGIHFLHGNLLEPIFKSKKLSITNYQLLITANLPYLTTAEWKNSQPEIKKYEPRSALDGGPDGLKYLRTLFVQLKTYKLINLQTIILEIGYKQGAKIKKLAKNYLPEYNVIIKKDLAGFDRLAIITRN